MTPFVFLLAHMEKSQTYKAVIAVGNAEESAFLTKDDIAQRCRVSRRTIDNWISKRMIPSIKMGRVLRFSWPSVQAALMRFELKAVS